MTPEDICVAAERNQSYADFRLELKELLKRAEEEEERLDSIEEYF